MRATIDLDSTIVAVHGQAKQGAAFGYTRVRGYHPLDDSVALRDDLGGDGPVVVVVVGGFIGAEVAATARGLGREVAVVDPLPTPIGRVVGPEIGRLFTELHHRHGVATHFGIGVEAVRPRATSESA